MALLTDLPLADARRIGARYGLDVVRVDPIPAGSVNSNFRFVSRSDTGEVLHFARIYEEQDEGGAQAELEILTSLADAGIPTTKPLVTTDGQLITSHADKPASVYPWVDGEVLCQGRVTAEWTRRLGRELARVHLASERIERLREGRFGVASVRARLEWIGTQTSDYAADVATIRSKLEHYAALDDPGVPRGLIHGDLFRDNVLVRDDEIAALIDFESASLGPFAFDVMVCIHAWCFTIRFEPPLVKGFLEGYVSERPLQHVEVRALGVQGALAALRFATTRITDFSMRAAPGEPPARDYRRFLSRLEGLESGVLGPIVDGVLAGR